MKELELGKKFLVITAHPDDESYLMCTALWKNYRAGGQNFIICATLGEKGTPKFKKVVTPSQLKQIRKQELFKASKFLHVKKLVLLNLPDGAVEQFKSKFYRSALAFAKKTKPDAVFSFGKEGISGHLDHMATAEVAKRVAKSTKLPLYCATLPPNIINRAYNWIKRRRIAPHYHNKEIPHPVANVMVPVEKDIKYKCLCIHKSQVDPKDPYRGYSKQASKEFWKADYFVLKNP